VEAEFAALLGSHADLKLPDGSQRVIRHGYDPVRPDPDGDRVGRSGEAQSAGPWGAAR
jgi:hypothetical protein